MKHLRALLLVGLGVAAGDEPFGAGVVVGRPEGAERYFTVVDAGRQGVGPSGAVWVVARTGDWPHTFPHSGVAVWLGASAQSLLEAPRVALGVDENVSANFGALAFDGRFVSAGGVENLQVPEAFRGIRVFESGADVFDVASWATTATLRGAHDGCVERRRLPHKLAPGTCEFDGHLSIARTRSGDLFLYARANLRQKNGGRFVQVAKRPRGHLRWRSFAPLEIEGYGWQSAFDHNIYFAAVNANPVDGGDTLLALMPVNDGRRAFVGLALSCDGARFSELAPVLNSDVAPYGRSTDHPVDGFLDGGDDVFFFVHRHVPGIEFRGRAAEVVRLAVPKAHLANFTRRATWSLRRRGQCGRTPWPPPRPAGPAWLWGPKAGDSTVDS